MTKNYSKLAQQIISAVGEKDNIKDVFHCITRLRFYLKTKSKANLVKIKSIDGVIGAQFSGDQLQIIIGNEVEDYYNALTSIIGERKKRTESVETSDSLNKNKWRKILSWKNLFLTLSSIFLPVVPVLAGTGLIKGIVTLIQMYTSVPASNGPLQVLIMASDCVFYFFPFLIAWSTAKKFKTNIPISLALAGILLYPTMTEGLAANKTGIDFFGLNIPFVKYASSSIPIILTVLVLSKLYPVIDKLLPKVLRLVFTPMIVILIMVPIELIAIAPLANYISLGLATFVNWLFKFSPIIAGLIVGSTRPLVVLSGMHLSLGAICIQNLAKYGYDVLLPINTMGTLAMCGASLGTWFYIRKTNDENLKQVSMSAFISAVIGITEPTIYGLLVKYSYVLYATMLGGGIAGAFVALFKGTANAYVNSCLLSLPVFAGKGFIYVCIGMAMAFAISFIIVQLIGIGGLSKEQIANKSGEFKDDTSNNESISLYSQSQKIESPMNGFARKLDKLNDGVFSKELMGKGVCIIPTDDLVTSPIEGIIETDTSIKHAIGLKTSDGLEILIHMGIDTVDLNGKYYDVLVKKGERVRKGQKLAEVDFNSIKKAGYSIACPIIITNTNEYKEIVPLVGNDENVKRGTSILKIIKRSN